MPYIELPCSHKIAIEPTGLQYLVGIMIFPNDEDKRRELGSAFKLANLQSFLDSNSQKFNITLTPELTLELKNHVSVDSIMSKAAKEYGDAATLCGAILLLSIGITENQASLGKSKRILDKMYKCKKKTSERTLERHWILYNSVSHLWAATAVFQELQKYDANIKPGFPCHESQLQEFLYLAEEFRKAGESRLPLRARKREYILNKRKTWKLPPNKEAKSKLDFKVTYNTAVIEPILQKIQLDKSPSHLA